MVTLLLPYRYHTESKLCPVLILTVTILFYEQNEFLSIKPINYNLLQKKNDLGDLEIMEPFNWQIFWGVWELDWIDSSFSPQNSISIIPLNPLEFPKNPRSFGQKKKTKTKTKNKQEKEKFYSVLQLLLSF